MLHVNVTAHPYAAWAARADRECDWRGERAARRGPSLRASGVEAPATGCRSSSGEISRPPVPELEANRQAAGELRRTHQPPVHRVEPTRVLLGRRGQRLRRGPPGDIGRRGSLVRSLEPLANSPGEIGRRRPHAGGLLAPPEGRDPGEVGRGRCEVRRAAGRAKVALRAKKPGKGTKAAVGGTTTLELGDEHGRRWRASALALEWVLAGEAAPVVEGFAGDVGDRDRTTSPRRRVRYPLRRRGHELSSGRSLFRIGAEGTLSCLEAERPELFLNR